MAEALLYKLREFFLIVCFVVVGHATALAHGGPHGVGPGSLADLAEELSDVVVNISTSQKVEARRPVPTPKVPDGSPFQDFFEEFFQGDEEDKGPRKVQSLGSGFVVDAQNGIIVTNNHVIDGADVISVNFSDGRKLDAKLLGRDDKTDIAVLQVKSSAPLKAASFGNSDVLRVGDWVMAIGNPFGLGGTVTVGIVSARNRDINAGPYDNFIQTDASINRGNSGGPLFNMKGEVVGINTAIFSPSGGSIGIGFAIPSQTAKAVIAQLSEFGETRRGWLGVRIQQVNDEIAESLGMSEAYGALVAAVNEEGPAKPAGILPGDVILRFDGQRVDAMRELPRMVASTDIGKEVELEVFRKGEVLRKQVVLGKLQEANQIAMVERAEEPVSANEGATSISELGLMVAKLDSNWRERFGLSSEIEGVVVTEVASGSNAEDKRVHQGDVIVEVAQEPVTSAQDIRTVIADMEKEGRKTVLLLLSNSSGELRFVAVRLSDTRE
ncbi:Do family serine endopeptidase [Polycladidibacter hongkongensis]|uniref:Do family serine endopeptidase n=1 Tax=Polycladidibacter hongkongensis TaxID=1647556 RepID=UPI00082C511C|nr:Do family serine endopeptidase [Pseudovibrio hongkongensis]